MKQKNQKNSNEIFADFTMSRIDRLVRDTMTSQQLNAVKDVLIANTPYSRHSVDLRGVISFFLPVITLCFIGSSVRWE